MDLIGNLLRRYLVALYSENCDPCELKELILGVINLSYSIETHVGNFRDNIEDNFNTLIAQNCDPEKMEQFIVLNDKISNYFNRLTKFARDIQTYFAQYHGE